jgi:hypothetical protein
VPPTDATAIIILKQVMVIVISLTVGDQGQEVLVTW